MEFDTKEIIFNKTPQENIKVHKEIQKTISQKTHEQKLFQKLESDEFVIEKPNTELKKKLYQARMNMGLSQRDLALRMNIKSNKITDWETGKSKPSPKEREYLQRILNTKFPK